MYIMFCLNSWTVEDKVYVWHLVRSIPSFNPCHFYPLSECALALQERPLWHWESHKGGETSHKTRQQSLLQPLSHLQPPTSSLNLYFFLRKCREFPFISQTTYHQASESTRLHFEMFYVRLKRALECWPNLSSETSHQTESVRKKRKKVSAFLVKSGAKSSKARLWNHMLAWWLAYLLVRNTFYIDTLRNTTSATFFALLHFSLQIFTPHLYTGDYKLWVWGGFAQPTKPSSNNSLLNGRSNQDIRSWFTFQKKQRITK